MNSLSAIDIDHLTMTEKVGLMELLWRDISKEPRNIEVPEWHLRILKEREKALANGETEFIDFEEAMQDIRTRIDAVHRANEDKDTPGS
jgi:hypothetical protein